MSQLLFWLMVGAATWVLFALWRKADADLARKLGVDRVIRGTLHEIAEHHGHVTDCVICRKILSEPTTLRELPPGEDVF